MSSSFLVPLAVTLTGLMADPGDGKAPFTAESRALSFLAQEVPRWARENKCYPGHNNGDAARALYTGARLSYPVSPKAVWGSYRMGRQLIQELTP